MTSSASSQYQAFLATKQVKSPDRGIRVSPDMFNVKLFPFQRAVTAWALRKGRAAILSDCGTGKTLMQLEWARHITGLGHRVLIVTPLAVAQQTMIEGRNMGVIPEYARHQLDSYAKIVVTNYEMVSHFDADAFGGVVLDECFAPLTCINVKNTDNTNGVKYIKDIRIGDRIINAAGVDTVADVHRREVQYVVRVRIGGQSIICSPNHPFYTQRGWIGAQDLQPGDYALATDAAMCLVRSGVCPQVPGFKKSAVLRDILLSEMADAPAGDYRQSPFASGSRQTWGKKGCMVHGGQPSGRERAGAYPQFEPIYRSTGASENLPPIERDGPQTFRAWGQWECDTTTSAGAFGCAWKRMESGVCLVTGQENSGLSHVLQARLSKSRAQSRHRSGWTLPPQPPIIGCKEGCETGWVRMDGFEVLEPGHPGLESLRDGDGYIYLYDIGATRHPSFSVNGILVHNSSILKNFEGKTRTALIQKFRDTPYKLCCTATPAPNDIAELANHAEFLGIMTRAEMLANWFVHDDDGWRLKGHATDDFYRWLSSWAMMLKTPSDIGFSDDGYILPPLTVMPVVVNGNADAIAQATGQLFLTTLKGVTGRAAARRAALTARVTEAAKIINASNEQWIVWCGLNDEGRELGKAILGAVVTEGKDSIDEKLAAIQSFLSGETRVWITKSSIAGFGLNLQRCHNVMFLGINDSYESFYQAVKRCHRFGQQSPVNVQICVSDLELPVLENLLGKQKQDELMSRNLIEQCRLYEQEELGVLSMQKNGYHVGGIQADAYQLLLGDCVERIRELPDESIDFSVFSPPFLSLYTYSDSDRDMGNSRSDAEFFEHFNFLIAELLRVVKPGRIVAVHVAQVAALLSRDGYIGIKDFRGHVINAFSTGGWYYHGDITIDKNPQIQAIRIHAKGLAFQQLKKDSSWMRPGLADYVLLFRKPGDNAVPIHPDISNEEWITWAHPVWYGISETDTLNAAVARENADDRHICPLQLGTIERAIRLWSNPGEMVLSPFAGIGSEGYVAIKHGRKFVGIELKESYYATARANLDRAVAEMTQVRLL